jgi:signal transduction histidine kinase/CheY-like chemotaxis protein
MASNDVDTSWLAEVIVNAADDAGIGVVVTALLPDLRHLLVTEAAASLFGYSAAEFAALPPLTPFQGPEFERVSTIARELREGCGAPRFVQATAVGRDGSPVSFDASIVGAVVDGAPVVSAFIVDASRTRMAEESLAASEERLIDVIDRLPDPAFASVGETIVYANRALRQVLDFPDEVLTRPGLLSELVMASGIGPLPGAEARYGGDYRNEITLSSKAGRSVTLEARSMVAQFRGAAVNLSFCRNITEKKQAEAQAMQADRLATLGTLAGGLAHAINNPLSSVVLNLEDLVRRMPELSERPELARRVEERLTLAKEAADRVARVVSQLRVFSRMRRTEEIGDIDLRRVVEDGLELVANEIRHRGQLELSLRPVPLIRGVEGRIEQAILTLLIFAVRMLPERPGSRSRLVVETHFHEGNIDVLVRCEGAPVPEGMVEQVIDPFSTGGLRERWIGLAICAEIVRSMGGELEVGGDDRSSSFCVRLPSEGWKDTDAHGVAISAPRSAAAGSTRARVLVIDDDPGVLSALRLMLQEHHDVTVMQDPHEAVGDIVAGAVYDVVFCDFVMPTMTGEDVYEAVKWQRPGFEGRIVFMTGAAFQQDAERFLSRVKNARIDKPFNLEQIEGLVRRAVESGE